MFEKFRKNIGKYFLNKELNSVNRKVVAKNFDDIQKIGIVFSINDEQDLKNTKRYINYFREEGIKKVKALGFYNGKENPHYLMPTLELNFLNQKDLNWYFRPVGTEVDNFIESDFDVLIDMISDDCFPMKFVVNKTKSRMKIGRFSEPEKDLYDLMIAVDKSKNLDYFMNQVNHYLRILNKTTKEV